MLTDAFIAQVCHNSAIIRIYTEVVPQLMWCSKVRVQGNVITLYVVTGLGSYEVNNCKHFPLRKQRGREGDFKESSVFIKYFLMSRWLWQNWFLMYFIKAVSGKLICQEFTHFAQLNTEHSPNCSNSFKQCHQVLYPQPLQDKRDSVK